jgi:hypothetical protein
MSHESTSSAAFGVNTLVRSAVASQEKLMKLFVTLLSALLSACGGGGGGASTSASVGGVVTGLPSGITVLLNNSGTETIAVPTNGAFAFAKRVAEGGSYSVTVAGENSSLCAVSNGKGSVAHDVASVSNVTVTCDYVTPHATTFDYFNVGVTVSGLLPGVSVTLMNHGNVAETVTATDNGLFVFPFQYAAQQVPGRFMDVTVKTQPSNQTCTVSNGTGPVPVPANFANVAVSCK